MATIEWKGVFPALLTPFTPDDHLDLPLYRANLEAQLDAGVDGIIIGGSLGEGGSLSHAERAELIRYSRDIIGKGVPVVMNIAEPTTKAAVQAALDAAEYGAQGLMLLPPMRYRADEAETLAFFRAVASATPLPIMIYNNPVDYKILVTLDMFEALAEIPNIQAVKESTRDVSNVTRMINRFGKRFRILCGVDTIAMECLLMGADGWVAGLVDAFPRETVAIYRLILAGRLEEALRIYRWFLPVLELDIHPKLVQYIKMAAARTGIGSEHVRAPRLIPEGNERTRIVEVLDEALKTRPQLPDYLNLRAARTVAA